MNTLEQKTLIDFISYLKNNKYKNKIQELKLEQCTDNVGEYILLSQIKIKKSQRELGYGSVVLDEICQLADKYNVRVIIKQNNLSGTDLSRLYGFFRKHNFFLIKNDNVIEMLCYPIKNKKL
jgi:hypothetical protein